MNVALVTGASTGIGYATAIALARKGFNVRAAVRSLDGAAPLVQVATTEKVAISPLQMDVDNDVSVRQAMAQVLKEHGRIDVLVNNAGIGVAGSVEEMPLATFRQVMETNFFGVLRCTQAVLPTMRSQRGGLIVNVSSVTGRVALAPQAAYAASKWAVEGLSECLAQEMKPFGIRVVLIEPGIILTPRLGKGPPQPANSPYPNARRLGAIFEAVRPVASAPFLVGELVAEIATGDSGRLRYRVGAIADSYFNMRASMTDEEWIEVAAGSDAEFAAAFRVGLQIDLAL